MFNLENNQKIYTTNDGELTLPTLHCCYDCENYGEVFEECNGDIIGCGDMRNHVKNAVKRLSEYEDTGLSPETIESIKLKILAAGIIAAAVIIIAAVRRLARKE